MSITECVHHDGLQLGLLELLNSSLGMLQSASPAQSSFQAVHSKSTILGEASECIACLGSPSAAHAHLRVVCTAPPILAATRQSSISTKA